MMTNGKKKEVGEAVREELMIQRIDANHIGVFGNLIPPINWEAVGFAAIKAIYEPTPEMKEYLTTAFGDCVHGFDTSWKAGIGYCLGVNDPIDFAIDGKIK